MPSRIELEYLVRGLRIRPLAGAAIVGVLAVGLTACGLVGLLADALLLRPLPFPEGDRLVQVEQAQHIWRVQMFDSPEVLRGRAYPARRPFPLVEAMSTWEHGQVIWTGVGQVTVIRTTPAMLAVLGLTPIIGQPLAGLEEVNFDPDAALVTDTFWRQQFDAQPTVLGQAVYLNGHPKTVVGVIPDGIASLLQGEAVGFLTLLKPHEDLFQTGVGFAASQVLARLRVPFDAPEVQAELAALNRSLGDVGPDGSARVRLVPLRQALLGETGRIIRLLGVSVGLMLVLVVANAAALVYTRGIGRRRDLAVMAALGASRTRLVAVGLAESVLLALMGGILAAGGVIWLGGTWLTTVVGPLYPGFQAGFPVGMWGMFGLLTLLVGIGAGIGPVWRVTGQAQLDHIRDVSGGVTSRRLPRSLLGLLALEMALAVAILAGAATVMSDLARLLAIDPGFSAAGAMAAPVSTAVTGSSEATFSREMYQRVIQAAGAVPGVVAVDLMSPMPMAREPAMALMITAEGMPEASASDQRHSALMAQAGPNTLQALDMNLRQGRWFEDGDVLGAPRVVVLNESLARQVFGESNPIGQRVRFHGLREVIGVVADIQMQGPHQPARPVAILCWLQQIPERMHMVVRLRGTPQEVGPALTAALARAEPALGTVRFRLLTDLMEAVLGRWWLLTRILGAFAVVTGLVAAAGVFGMGLLAVAAGERTLAVRQALGATRWRVFRQALSGYLGPLGIGTGIGLVAGGWLSVEVAERLTGTGGLNAADLLVAGVLGLGSAVVLLAVPLIGVVRGNLSDALRDR